MKIRIPHLSTEKWLTYFFFIASVLVAVLTAYFVFKLDVIKDWKLVLPDQQIHAGQTVVLKSEYHKLRDVKGTATRYIECKTVNNVFIAYPLNEAVADRQQGKGGTGLVLPIPSYIPGLPTTCKFRVTVDYPVIPFRHVIETNVTEEFTLYPPLPESSETNGTGATTQSSQSQSLPVSPVRSQSRGNALSSSSNSTPTERTSQPNNLQPATNPAPSAPNEPVESPSVLETLNAVVRDIPIINVIL